ncbi:hypothetical protein AMTRI_Chr03g142160 [Amborella trichopoda]|uniref:Uncharacterized protein n=1 Tax=Amborella trichopoda TaxID=13333 RepID=W1PMS7_AMBTC|nr:uncharacterized protein At4g18257 isoform X2 [Amborella trichopoda]ERN09099.1 hypothetical protein AMTR_s00014p00080820 [Amborella trichopoda]|eukprot:XP_006847518.1 uncharacterized protein At4g18257 isoform X2 [Amborella trichopoda]
MVEENAKKERRVESLGWLTESSVMPKKHKTIEGVSASSIVELRAQLYRTQEEAKKVKDLAPDIEFHRAKKKVVPVDVHSRKNAGVESRANKDKLELKAVEDGLVSYAALEKKAELYEKLARGELSDEEDMEKYCVDFFRKTLDTEEQSQLSEPANAPSVEDGNLDDEDDLSVPGIDAKLFRPGRTGDAVDNNEHKRFVREVHEETNEAREKASSLKLRRQVQAAAHREKLRQAYLRKQLEKLKAAKTQQSSPGDAAAS